MAETDDIPLPNLKSSGGGDIDLGFADDGVAAPTSTPARSPRISSTSSTSR